MYDTQNSDLAELQDDVTGLNSSLVEVINDGAKNLLHFDGLSSATSNGVSFTLNGDYSVTATRVSSSSSTASVDLTLNGSYAYLDDWCDGEHYISGCPASGSSTTYEVLAQTYGTTDYIKRDYGNGILLDAKSASNINIVFRLIVRSGFTGTITFKPMVTTKAQFATSPTYEPYALGNQYLTPALIEQVDSGAKNIFDITKPDSTRDTTVTPLSNGGATLSCTNAVWTQYFKNVTTKTGVRYKAILYIDSLSSGAPTFMAYVRKNSSSGDNYCQINGTSVGVYKNTFIAESGTTCVCLYVNNGATSKTASADIRFMLCTEADYGVSQTFVPYRPNWDLVGKKTLLSNQCIAGNLSEFNFDVHDYNSGAGATAARYRHGLLVGGTNGNDPILYHVFLDAQNAVTLTPILLGARTFTATCSNDVLTITANIVVYGGLRLLWLD